DDLPALRALTLLEQDLCGPALAGAMSYHLASTADRLTPHRAFLGLSTLRLESPRRPPTSVRTPAVALPFAVRASVCSAPMTDLFSIDGKVALVTGGSRGIGLMIARGFVEAGAKVYISSRKADVCDRVAADLSRSGKCISLPADVSTEAGARG